MTAVLAGESKISGDRTAYQVQYVVCQVYVNQAKQQSSCRVQDKTQNTRYQENDAEY